MLGKLLKRKRIIVTVISCLALVGGTWVWVQSHQQTSTTSYLFGTVTRGTLAVSASASGNLMASTQANVSAQISGTVVAIHVAQGDTVHAGQTLYEVHNQTATADIATAYGAYVAAKSVVEHARTDKLQVEATNAITQNDATTTPAQKNVAAQQVTAAQAAVQAAEQNQSAAWLHYGITKDQSSPTDHPFTH